MPSAAYIMEGWCIDFTYTATGFAIAVTRRLRFRCSPNAAITPAQACRDRAVAQCQLLEAYGGPVTYGTPFKDTNQDWANS